MLLDLLEMLGVSLTSMPARMLAVLIVSVVGTYLLTFPVTQLGRRSRILDEPGHRSSHTEVVPRTGGLAVVAGAILTMLLLSKPSLAFIVAGGIGALIFVVSLWDDVRTIPAIPRLLTHVLVAALAVWMVKLEPRALGLPFADVPLSIWIGGILAVLFVVGFVNFFNFMDGINGIAASQCVFGGGTIALLLWWGGQNNSVLTATVIAGASLGFLPHNFPRARLFLGDVGSTTLGFLLAMLTLVGSVHSPYPWVAFILPLGVFIYDATFTLIKRVLRGENPTQAHREHHYQLLVRCGWSHARVMSVQATLMLLHSVGAVVYARGGDATRLGVLLVLLAINLVYSIAVHRYFRTHRTDQPAVAVGAATNATSGAAS